MSKPPPELAFSSFPGSDRVRCFLERNQTALRALAHRCAGYRLRQYESVSDLLQSACLGLLDDVARVRAIPNEDDLWRWFRTSLIRKAVDRVRYHERRPATSDSAALSAALGPMTPPLLAAERRERADDLWSHVHALPPEYRDAIMLRFRKHLPLADVAAQMGRSESATKALLYRARALLARALSAPN